MGDIMQEIINEVKEGGFQLINHMTSLLCVIAIYVWGIRFSKVNEVMHLGMVFIASMTSLATQCTGWRIGMKWC
jgi:hypothetical protein